MTTQTNPATGLPIRTRETIQAAADTHAQVTGAVHVTYTATTSDGEEITVVGTAAGARARQAATDTEARTAEETARERRADETQEYLGYLAAHLDTLRTFDTEQLASVHDEVTEAFQLLRRATRYATGA